ncbi:Ovarian tumour, otubain [Lasallia pustulata]|uniref:Ovarian tumour, otubain n=1 Tax=Lasallia pustulata TaxID=136370 RepID=A0A1W5D9A6_9LECA|nr:Ovarian tumour, otubain [Lasallia pustulata]
MGLSADEFPLLAAYGLYVSQIRGDGNCLFNALSDQLYGNQASHHEIRSRVIDYMRDNASYYKQFIDVHPGGGVRRNPKRKNVGAYSTPTAYLVPTAEEVERVFESHLQQMARGGTYGDNMEITAFSAAYGVDVKIYQRDFAYLISAPEEEEEASRQVLHIAYHLWEHFSSVRNVNGPHTGLPHVKETYMTPEVEKKHKQKLAQTPYVLPWRVNLVCQSLPYLADRTRIHKTLEECKGNIDIAVSKLLDAEERGSVSSTQESSSVEREPDSDEEALCGPNKKQDRRLSRATRTVLKEKDEQKKRDLALRAKTNHDPPTTNGHTPLSGIKDTNSAKEEDGDETEEEDWENDPSYRDSASASPSASASDYSAASKLTSGAVRLKLSQPKRENEKDPPPSDACREVAHGVKAEHHGDSGGGAGGGKTQQRQAGPRQKRVTQRDKRDMKKAAQKAAAKARKQGRAAGKAANGKNGIIAAAAKEGKENSPAIEAGIKTLYI